MKKIIKKELKNKVDVFINETQQKYINVNISVEAVKLLSLIKILNNNDVQDDAVNEAILQYYSLLTGNLTLPQLINSLYSLNSEDLEKIRKEIKKELDEREEI